MLLLIAYWWVLAVLAIDKFLTAGECIYSIDPFGWTLVLLLKEDYWSLAEELLSSALDAGSSLDKLDKPLTLFLAGDLGVGLVTASLVEELI